MYKLLIVDDEEWIRLGISRSIDWSKMNISEVETACNGKNAIEKIRENPPNLVVSDVVMPQMTGIQLSEWIHNEHPEIKVILISGYDQFEYARQAIRFGVADYILKPVEEDKLLETVKSCLVQLDIQRNRASETASYQASLHSLKQLFYLKLIDVDTSQIDYGNYKNLIQIPFREDCTYCNALVRFEEDSDEENACRCIIQYFTNNVPEQVNWEIIENNHTVVILVESQKQNAGLEDCLTQILTRFVNRAGSNFSSVCIVSKEAIGIKQFRKNLMQAETIYRNAYTLPSPGVYTAGQLSTMQRGKVAQNRAASSAFIKMLTITKEMPNEQECMDFFDSVLNESPLIGKEELGKFLFRTLLEMMRVLENSRQISGKCLGEGEMLGWVFNCSTLQECRTKLLDFVQSFSNTISSQDDDAHKKVIRDALEYISANYSRDISLADISEHLHICKCYFSQLFAKEMDTGFAKYLMNYRIDKAKELLDNTNLRIYQISEKVGYSDVKYFMKLFKKNVGVSPQIYREKKNH